MGVDAEMRLELAEPMTDLKSINERACDAFPDLLCAAPFDLTSPTDITVHLLTRYYGPGYERGDAPLLFSFFRWCRSVFPGARIFYGGDRTDEELTQEREDDLWAHFVAHGHAYRRGD